MAAPAALLPAGPWHPAEPAPLQPRGALHASALAAGSSGRGQPAGCAGGAGPPAARPPGAARCGAAANAGPPVGSPAGRVTVGSAHLCRPLCQVWLAWQQRQQPVLESLPLGAVGLGVLTARLLARMHCSGLPPAPALQQELLLIDMLERLGLTGEKQRRSASDAVWLHSGRYPGRGFLRPACTAKHGACTPAPACLQCCSSTSAKETCEEMWRELSRLLLLVPRANWSCSSHHAVQHGAAAELCTQLSTLPALTRLNAWPANAGTSL